MNNHTHANDFPAPFVLNAQDDVIHYSHMNGGVNIRVMPYTGMKLGDRVSFGVRFDNTNTLPGWSVPVDKESQLINGVLSGFTREYLEGNTWVEIYFSVGSKQSEIRKYTLVFDLLCS
ncbi:hypothetical protein [Pseudomonas fluorescens]|uniref:Uncharacterized protein n=1 Tax=Pseudomonas fluorescens TaxID=294 RepID=A0A5E6XS35_PSEFL|nr:hypothetical protein [Pseudomonas fluorescens]VVN42681.1 hypothetical protein PS659_05555 [Pseudomonas fluorescens]